MTRIRPGQKPVHRPSPVAKQRFQYELDNLVFDVAELERTLPHKVVVFAREYVKGDCTIREAARRAGYSEKSLSQRGNQIVNDSNATKLVDCYRRLDHLQNGTPLGWKRYYLRRIVESPHSQDNARIAAIRLLAELDGNLKENGNSRAIIQVHLNLGGAPSNEIIDHEEEVPMIGDDRPNQGGAARGLPTAALDP